MADTSGADFDRPASPPLSSAPATEPHAQSATAATLPAATSVRPDRGIAVPLTQHRPSVMPLSPERYKIQFTATSSTYDKLRRAHDLLRHVVPNGDPAEIFDRALTVLIADLERRRLAAVERPRLCQASAEGSRHIPAGVKRAVWTRDGGRCAFLGARGRCPETGFLEWHHVEPFAAGGAATVDNIQLRCRAHNAHEARLFFGDSSHDPLAEDAAAP